MSGPVVHVDAVEEQEQTFGRWGGFFRVLTPTMRPAGGKLGVNHVRVPPGRALTPFHTHALEDEVFYVLSGRGVLRYGDEMYALAEGDCVSCPAGTGTAHQIANPYDDDLVYLAIGNREAHEVCTYPDSGKVMVRSLGQVGALSRLPYLEGEGEVPKVFELLDKEV